jgi:hypothetical protein
MKNTRLPHDTFSTTSHMRRRLPTRASLQASQPLPLPSNALPSPCQQHCSASSLVARSVRVVLFCCTWVLLERGREGITCGRLLLPLIAVAPLLCDPTPNPAANRKRSLSVCLHERQNVSQRECTIGWSCCRQVRNFRRCPGHETAYTTQEYPSTMPQYGLCGHVYTCSYVV